MRPAILQFGTGRLLQAHADLMIGEALARGEAPGPIVAVATSGSPAGRARAQALAAGGGFPVRIRGLVDGRPVEREERVTSVQKALDTETAWDEVIAHAIDPHLAIWLSNTADRGYELDPGDGPATRLPKAFPAKLLKLLHARFRTTGAPVSLHPLELITDNGRVLRRIVTELASSWGISKVFLDWLAAEVRFADTLVDRIVSEPIEPVGAIAEPYALWAIRAQEGLFLPCHHPDLVVTEDLEFYARQKLFILNLGHTWLADLWLQGGRPADETVRAILEDPQVLASLDALYDEEILPVFAALGLGEAAAAYRQTTLDRFKNPFLRHKLADIAQNHAAKRLRRAGGLLELAAAHAPHLALPRLRALLAG